jgi:hypothetical protein
MSSQIIQMTDGSSNNVYPKSYPYKLTSSNYTTILAAMTSSETVAVQAGSTFLNTAIGVNYAAGGICLRRSTTQWDFLFFYSNHVYAFSYVTGTGFTNKYSYTGTAM